MTITNKKESLFLFVGDIVFFAVALWVTLIVRYFEIPSTTLLYNHLTPFSFLFLVWVLIYFISGLYGKHTVILKSKLPSIILRAQFVNVLLAATFFSFLPIFGIAPKTNLFIYLIISSGLIVFWRLILFPGLHVKKGQRALLIASGSEMKELYEEVNNNTRYHFQFLLAIDLDLVNTTTLIERVEQATREKKVTLIVVQAKDERVAPALPSLYTLIFDGVQFIDMSRVYESIFERVPVSFIKHHWLIDNVPLSSKIIYDLLKRLFDLAASFILGVLSLVVYPFIYIAIKLDDGGSVFFTHKRIGEKGRQIHILKFRSMNETEMEKVTRVGRVLRKTRLDELPQLWSVLRGDQSLIGPRPEIPSHVSMYEQKIPYYNIRHLIKPGLSGWAQIHQETPPKFGVHYDGTKLKLSYDLYYIKNRSFVLDMQIALLTIKTLFSRSGL